MRLRQFGSVQKRYLFILCGIISRHSVALRVFTTKIGTKKVKKSKCRLYYTREGRGQKTSWRFYSRFWYNIITILPKKSHSHHRDQNNQGSKAFTKFFSFTQRNNFFQPSQQNCAESRAQSGQRRCLGVTSLLSSMVSNTNKIFSYRCRKSLRKLKNRWKEKKQAKHWNQLDESLDAKALFRKKNKACPWHSLGMCKKFFSVFPDQKNPLCSIIKLFFWHLKLFFFGDANQIVNYLSLLKCSSSQKMQLAKPMLPPKLIMSPSHRKHPTPCICFAVMLCFLLYNIRRVLWPEAELVVPAFSLRVLQLSARKKK